MPTKKVRLEIREKLARKMFDEMEPGSTEIHRGFRIERHPTARRYQIDGSDWMPFSRAAKHLARLSMNPTYHSRRQMEESFSGELRGLLSFTKHCPDNMHEPDCADISAAAYGGRSVTAEPLDGYPNTHMVMKGDLDNACGDSPTHLGLRLFHEEYNDEGEVDRERSSSFDVNMASLVAIARTADLALADRRIRNRNLARLINQFVLPRVVDSCPAEIMSHVTMNLIRIDANQDVGFGFPSAGRELLAHADLQDREKVIQGVNAMLDDIEAEHEDDSSYPAYRFLRSKMTEQLDDGEHASIVRVVSSMEGF